MFSVFERDIPLNLDELQAVTMEWSSDERQLLSIYINEAIHFFSLLQGDLGKLPSGSVVKEIGSGIGLLSLLVADQGFKVVSFEPATAGFTLMHKFRSVIRASWTGRKNSVDWIPSEYKSDQISPTQPVYVFAVNVIEHVITWKALLVKLVTSECKGSRIRLIFPNYLYPYEPHFNIPTVFNKKLTKVLFARKIGESNLNDPQDFWDNLSWPTGSQLARLTSELGCSCVFSPDSTFSYLDRVASDPIFRKRKGKIAVQLAILFLPRMRQFLGSLSPRFLPVIDAEIRV